MLIHSDLTVALKNYAFEKILEIEGVGKYVTSSAKFKAPSLKVTTDYDEKWVVAGRIVTVDELRVQYIGQIEEDFLKEINEVYGLNLKKEDIETSVVVLDDERFD